MGKLQQLNHILSALSTLYPKTSNTLKILGLLLLAKKILTLLYSIYRVSLRPRKNFQKRYGRNTWALITGSSDGIGKGVAVALARQGFNLVLSARTESKLEAARAQIRTLFPWVQVRTLVINYQRSEETGYLQDRLREVGELDISILVNNVGVDVLDSYHKLSEQTISNLIKVNCLSVTSLTRIFIPRFIQRHSNRGLRSAIINVASLAGEIPMAYHNVYSASKAFVDTLSRALSYEYSSQMDVMSVNPSEVSTPMTFHKKDVFTISARQCAEGMLDCLGYERQTNGYWSHQLQGAIYRAVPETVFSRIWMGVIAPEFMEDRKRAQQNQGQGQGQRK